MSAVPRRGALAGMRRSPDEKRAAVARAALAEFRDNGYVGASVDSIAARAAVSKPTVYRYFGSKEGLFVTAVGERLELAYGGMEARAEALHHLDVRAALFAYMRYWVEVAVEGPVMDLRRIVAGEVHRFPELGERWAEINIERADAPLIELLEHFVARGDLQIKDYKLPTRQLIAMTLGSAQLIATFRPRYPLREELDDMVEGGVETFVRGYGSPHVRDRSSGSTGA